jgi:hypothetical protein
MSSITVTVSGLGGRVDVDLPEGANVGDARNAAEIDPGLQVRTGGRPVGDQSELSDGQHLVTAPPAAKHGTSA